MIFCIQKIYNHNTKMILFSIKNVVIRLPEAKKKKKLTST